jgi:rhamnulokinase
MERAYLAIDLGAESGRVIRAVVGDETIRLDEAHRFRTQGLVVNGRRQWDITRIYADILEGLRAAARLEGPPPAGIGIDTWGVDFGLIAADGSILGNPVHYRDSRTEGMIEAAGRVAPQPEIYARTGIMSLPFNTLYQLLALAWHDSPLLPPASSLLFIGPLLGYFLTGRVTCEYTIASTGQMLDAKTRDWDRELLEKLGAPTGFLPPVTPPGTIVGPILPQVAADTGLDPATPYISTAVHDTACAVAAVPVDAGGEGDWAYLSSGTWSLIGAELDEPTITEAGRQASYTNEGGVGGKIRFLKNILGLWLVQECRRAWAADAGGDDAGLDYATLAAEAEAAKPFLTVIGVEDARLFAPPHMPSAILECCRAAGAPEPRTRGQFVRCALESLALSYRRSLRQMDRLLGRQTQRLHVVGGGVQNKLLCQLTADACGIPVHAGPVEATALGNVLVQALATGALKSLEEGRALVRRSQSVTVYEPRHDKIWAALEAEIYPE